METTPTTLTTRPTHRRRRWAVAASLLAVLLLLLALAGAGGDPGRAGPDPDDPDAEARFTTAEPMADGERDEDALDAEDDSDDVSGDVELVDDDGGGSDPADGVFDPEGDTDPVDPCAGHDAADGSLRVVPDPVVLPDGDYADELHIRNCGAAPVDWTAATKPSVTLGAAAGSLDPGEHTTLGFTIQKQAWDPGAIEFKIKVSEPGFNEYVDVHAYRPLTGADMVASDELTIGPHLGGCADQCITKALITRNLSSPNVSLEVGTSVFADVRVYLSKNPPVDDPAGNPVFPGTPAKATSPGPVQSWTTPLSNLQPSTKYFIIVKATDVDGDKAYRSGSFRTVTPIDGPGQLAPQDQEPGCANQCITKAVVTPGDGLAPAHLSVKTHTPARFQLALSTWDVFYEDGVPMFGNTAVAKESGLQHKESWEVDIAGLQPNTTYNGIVRATDANGKIQYALGSFTTDGVDVEITIHKVHLTQDGDSQDWNRGEVRFAWGVGDDTVGTRGEDKMHPGTEIGFGDHSTYTVHDASGHLPTVYVSASERDADGLVEFCTGGNGASHSPGSNGSCDTKWNVAASSPIDVTGLASLADCSTMGLGGEWGDAPCTMLVSEDLSADYPEFWAIVSFRVID